MFGLWFSLKVHGLQIGKSLHTLLHSLLPVLLLHLFYCRRKNCATKVDKANQPVLLSPRSTRRFSWINLTLYQVRICLLNVRLDFILLENLPPVPGVCVCFLCVFFPFILDIKFVGRTSRGHTGARSHRISHPPSFCGACLDFSREKDSAIPFPRRP